MLEIRNLTANVDGRPMLKGIDLTIGPGEVHAIMGPNGAGKSTLAKLLAGDEAYEITGGTVTFEGRDLFAMAPEERAAAGLFLGFQYPVEIPGVTNAYFLRTALNAQRKVRGEGEIPAPAFLKTLKEKMAFLDMDAAFRNRFVNVGFSGGEKKRNEILQLLVLDPKLAVLDEIDSGLDVDALKVVAKGVNSLRDGRHAVLLVTHYQRLLDEIVPDFVHALVDGRIVRTGGKDLAVELDATGYAGLGA